MAPKRCSKWPDPSQLCQEEGLAQEEEDFALTQCSSQVQRNLQRLSGAQVDQKVSELVQFLLVKDQKKIPIKRADILKNIIKDYKDVYPEIINRAGRTLQQVFGLRLVEIDTKHHVYILVSDLLRLEGENLKQDHRTARLGLLTVILSFIYMRGNAAKESDVWDMLKRLGVEPRKPHKLFGDVKKLVTVEFVQQKSRARTPKPGAASTVRRQLRWRQQRSCPAALVPLETRVGTARGRAEGSRHSRAVRPTVPCEPRWARLPGIRWDSAFALPTPEPLPLGFLLTFWEGPGQPPAGQWA